MRGAIHVALAVALGLSLTVVAHGQVDPAPSPPTVTPPSLLSPNGAPPEPAPFRLPVTQPPSISLDPVVVPPPAVQRPFEVRVPLTPMENPASERDEDEIYDPEVTPVSVLAPYGKDTRVGQPPALAGDKKDSKDKKDKKDEFPSFRITGFTQLDGGWYSQDPVNEATVGNAQDGVGFRRARLATVGKVGEFNNYMVELDFATAGRPSFFDLWIEQGNLPLLGVVRVGQYCQPFSVDALTGFRNLTFLERSLPFLAFVPFRRIGAMSYNNVEDEMTAWGFGVFRTGAFNNAPLGDSRFATDIGDVGGWSFTGRLTHLLYYDELAKDRYLWHVGGSYDFSRTGANTAAGSASPVPFYQSRVLPEFGPLGASENAQLFGQAFAATPVFVDSGRYPADSFNLFGVETLAQWGAWGFTSEFMATQVNSVVGSIFYHGAYAQLAYRLTGENRVYDKKTGTLGKIFPYSDFIPMKRDGICGWGAWEVAARLSYVDIRNPAALNGHYLAGTSDIGNGLLTDVTLGMTWFLNAYTKLQFNYIHCMLDNDRSGYSLADLYVTRCQVDF